MAPITRMTTSLGYQVTATPNHEFLLPDDSWRHLEDLEIGERVRLLPTAFGLDIQRVPVDLGLPILGSSILIDEDFAEFLGVFMGDGCISKDKNGSGWTLSVVFDSKDRDAIDRMKSRMMRLFGRVSERVTGTKKGCIELRLSSKYFGELFDSLGLYYRTESARTVRRKVHVPPYIMASPRPVVAAFLRGLFDADGFIGYQTPRIAFFSKHEQFIRDVQLLLLSFGITSKLTIQTKKSGDGHLYTGRCLTLRKHETVAYMGEIGFLSARKNARWADQSGQITAHFNDSIMDLTDGVISKEDAGFAEVYDMEVLPEHYYSANGFWVHNSSNEAFRVSGRVRFLQEWVDAQSGHVANAIPSRALPAPLNGIDGLRVYVLPPDPATLRSSTRKLILACDVAEGLEGGDYSAAVLIDADTLEELACLHGHWEPDEYAERLHKIAEAYGARIVVERNNHGHAVLSKLRGLGSRRIADGHDEKQGWLTNITTKPIAVDALAAALRDGAVKVRSQRALDEFMVYTVLANGKTSSPAGYHDDFVMAWSIALGWKQMVGWKVAAGNPVVGGQSRMPTGMLVNPAGPHGGRGMPGMPGGGRGVPGGYRR